MAEIEKRVFRPEAIQDLGKARGKNRRRVPEIPCRVSFGALSRQAGADAPSRDREHRLFFQWCRKEIERIAPARYAVGDFCGGVVMIDADGIGSPPGQR